MTEEKISEKEYEESPFFKNKIPVGRRKKKVGETLTFNPETGEGEVVGLHKSVAYDKEGFVKVYEEVFLKGLLGLGTAGIKALSVLIHTVGLYQNKDKYRITLTFDELYEYNRIYKASISEQIFRRGMVELLEAGFMARSTKKGRYFVNHRMIVNGERFKIIQEFNLTKNSGDKDAQ